VDRGPPRECRICDASHGIHSDFSMQRGKMRTRNLSEMLSQRRAAGCFFRAEHGLQADKAGVEKGMNSLARLERTLSLERFSFIQYRGEAHTEDADGLVPTQSSI
jgi:hypothetical protein